MEALVIASLIAIPVLWIFTWLAMPKCHRYVAAVVETGKCRACGYDLMGLEVWAKCPECGSELRGIRKAGAPGVQVWALIGTAFTAAICLGVITVAMFGEGRHLMFAMLIASILYLIMLIPWLVFALAALNSRTCHPRNVIVVSFAQGVGMFGGVILVFAMVSGSMGYFMTLFVAPLLSSICALIAACGCRLWQT